MDLMLAASLDDQVLIRRVQQGDSNAMAELYQRYALLVFRYCVRRVTDRATAEDLVGEIFLDVVESLPRYVDRGVPFAAWLIRIAHRRLVDYYRWAALRITENIPEEMVEETEAIENQVVHHDQVQCLRIAMTGLTQEQQLVVQLRFIEDYSLELTAQILGKTTGAVKSLQHRALRQLARKLRR